MGTVVHTPRIAWDGARVLVHAASAEATFAWMADRLGPILPDDMYDDYLATRNHLIRPDRDDVENVEAGVWRVRLEALVQDRPELVGPLGALIAEVNAAMRAYSGRFAGAH
jgi:hypothetical protein